MKQTSLKSNFLFNLIYQILAVITPIFTTPYISRVLSADGIGKYSYALSIVTYFGIFGCLGTATYGQLEIARNRDNKKLLHKTVSEIFFGRLVTLMISLLIYFVVILKASKQYKLLYFIEKSVCRNHCLIYSDKYYVKTVCHCRHKRLCYNCRKSYRIYFSYYFY